MIIDVHAHYTFTCRAAACESRFSFEPADCHGRPGLDSYISPRAQRRIAWRLFRHIVGISPRLPAGEETDAALDRLYDAHLGAPGPVERVVLLAFDAYHDDEGRPAPLPQRRGDPGTDIYTANSLVRSACRKRPDRFLFGASVHPYRPGAVECVQEVFAGGACLLKWLPLHQNIDIHDPRTLAVLRCCAEVGLPVLVHYNSELTLATNHPEHQSVHALFDVLRRLRRAGEMPTTIVAHVATPVTPLGDRASFQSLVDALLGEFADAPLYADISALTTWGKAGFLKKLAAMQEVHPKLLFGSDFPVPQATLRLRRYLGDEYENICAATSWVHRLVPICRRMGFNEIVFHRAAELLPNVGHFAPAAPATTP